MTRSKDPHVPSGEGDLKFEEAVEQIEAVIEKIESGEAGLERSLREYERATKLIVHCQSILKSAQQKIVELTSDTDGRLRVSDHGGEGSDAI